VVLGSDCFTECLMDAREHLIAELVILF